MGPLSDKWARPALLAGWVVFAGGCAPPPGAPAPSAPARPPPLRPADSDKRFVIAPELEPPTSRQLVNKLWELRAATDSPFARWRRTASKSGAIVRRRFSPGIP